MRSGFIPAFAMAAAVYAVSAQAEVPSNYPPEYSQIVDAAKAEGALRVYATTDESNAGPLLEQFKSEYPEIEVEYFSLGSVDLYNRVLSEKAAGQATVDLVWTGAPDISVLLSRDGYALEYASPEIPALPDWAVYKNMAYGTTSEPLSFVYSKALLPPESVPQSHQDLLRLLTEQRDTFDGRIAMSDPTTGTSSTAWALNDIVEMENYWDLIAALRDANVQYSTSAPSIEKVGAGELVLAWNVYGSYIAAQMENPNIGMVIPSDYVITSSRTAFVSADAIHPNAAKLFLDFLLSKRGQELIANQAKLFSIRPDVEGDYTLARLMAERGDALRPMTVTDEQVERTQDPAKREAFVQKFNEVMAGGN